MLSEGWDARNVTQILGLRAFQSQLLCEQVVGRGLRRTDYTDLSQPEYVDVYGVPVPAPAVREGDTGASDRSASDDLGGRPSGAPRSGIRSLASSRSFTTSG